MENFIKKNIQEDAHFIVSLDGLNLSKKQLARIDKGIKDIVLKEIASMDTKGDVVLNHRILNNPKFTPLKIPELAGIWVENFERLVDRQQHFNRFLKNSQTHE